MRSRFSAHAHVITIKERPSEVSEIHNFPRRGLPGGTTPLGPPASRSGDDVWVFHRRGAAQKKWDLHYKTESITRNLDVLSPLIRRNKVIKTTNYHVPAIRMHKIRDPSLGYR